MGVNGLWPLLEPSGRRINVEGLQGKVLAIDASIWLYQFIRAMRDAQGNLLRNAHLLGFLRRICKLLFHKIRPVFVFDGAAPHLKRQTVIARRRRREVQSAQLRKAAEKMLIAKLKHKFAQQQIIDGNQVQQQDQQEKVLAIAGSEEQQEIDQVKQEVKKQVLDDNQQQSNTEFSDEEEYIQQQLEDDIKQMQNQHSNKNVNKNQLKFQDQIEGTMIDDDLVDDLEQDNDQQIKQQNELRTRKSKINQSKASLNKQASQSTAQKQQKTSQKQGIVNQNLKQEEQDLNIPEIKEIDQQLGKLREQVEVNKDMLSGDDTDYSKDDQSSYSGDSSGDNSGEDDDQNLMIPSSFEELDPLALSSLPPSMQLDIMMKMREKLVAESREHYQQLNKPEEFSDYQMERYLKAVNFRNKLEQVRDNINKTAAAKLGVQTMPIMGEEGGEYILRKSNQSKPDDPNNVQKEDDKVPIVDIYRAQLDRLLREKGSSKSKRQDKKIKRLLEKIQDESIAKQDIEIGVVHPYLPAPSNPLAKALQREANIKQEYQNGLPENQIKSENIDVPFEDITDEPEFEPIVNIKQEEGNNQLQEQQNKDDNNDMKIQVGFDNNNQGDEDDMFKDIVGFEDIKNQNELDKDVLGQYQKANEQAATDIEWENEDANQNQQEAIEGDELQRLTKNWRERMVQRHKYWSSSHGFKLGRSLGKWAEADDNPEDDNYNNTNNELNDKDNVFDNNIIVSSDKESDKGLNNIKDKEQLWGDESGYKQDEEKLDLTTSQDDEFMQIQKSQNVNQNIDRKSKMQDMYNMQNKESQRILNQIHPIQQTNDNQNLEEQKQMNNNQQQDHSDNIQQETKEEYKQRLVDGLIQESQQAEKFKDQQAGGRKIPEQGLERDQEYKSEIQQTSDNQQHQIKQNQCEKQDYENTIINNKEGKIAIDQQQIQVDNQNAQFVQQPLDNINIKDQQQDKNLNNSSMYDQNQQANGVVNQENDQDVKIMDDILQIEDDKMVEGLVKQDNSQFIETQRQIESEIQKQNQKQTQKNENNEQNTQSQKILQNQDFKPQQEYSDNQVQEYNAWMQSQQERQQQQGQQSQQVQLQPIQQQQMIQQQQQSQNRVGGVSFQDLENQLENLMEDSNKLAKEHRRVSKFTEQPTPEMYTECQELLQIFGLPYIVSPVEAEAQCAFLDQNELVEGIITDDNDVFLFGGNTIYRHLFEGKKYVEEYHSEHVAKELGLSRDKLIRLALLLGSDYTEGVQGIGIVNAIETVNAFTSDELLKDFRKWVENVDQDLMQDVRKKGKNKDLDTIESQETIDDKDTHGKIKDFKQTHRQVRRNWELPQNFPSIDVVAAYKTPVVDKDKSRFSWGNPDRQLLQQLCQTRFGWDDFSFSQVIDPVLQAWSFKEKQSRLESFFKYQQRFAKIRSKRLQQAFRGITGKKNEELEYDYDNEEQGPSENYKNRQNTKGRKQIKDKSQDQVGLDIQNQVIQDFEIEMQQNEESEGSQQKQDESNKESEKQNKKRSNKRQQMDNNTQNKAESSQRPKRQRTSRA